MTMNLWVVWGVIGAAIAAAAAVRWLAGRRGRGAATRGAW